MRRIVAILAVSAIALAACGGSSGSKSDSNGNSDSFSKLFEQSRNATLKVTYSSTDENGTTGGDAFTIAQDGPNKTAFITGATGSIGGAIARAFHGQGATVALSGTRREVLDELARSLEKRIHVLPCNLADKDAVEELVPKCEQLMGQLDILVANG